MPMTDISNIDVPEGTDELSRNTRRAWRERLNSVDAQDDHGRLGYAGGRFVLGLLGTSASLFDTYHVDTLWLMSVRQILAGLLFMAWLSRATAHAWSSFGRRPLIASSCCSLPLLACCSTSFAIFRPCA
ncbi:MAG: hypothetical protein ACLU0O_06790 [Collinsella sp.]